MALGTPGYYFKDAAVGYKLGWGGK